MVPGPKPGGQERSDFPPEHQRPRGALNLWSSTVIHSLLMHGEEIRQCVISFALSAFPYVVHGRSLLVDHLPNRRAGELRAGRTWPTAETLPWSQTALKTIFKRCPRLSNLIFPSLSVRPQRKMMSVVRAYEETVSMGGGVGSGIKISCPSYFGPN